MQIFILGMHRSGTSVITRLINMMGVYVGAPDILLPANTDNPKGFWERRDVINCNRDLLRISGCVWYMTSNFDSTLPVPANLSRHMQNIIGEMNIHMPWVIKDPRLCLTLHYWLPFCDSPLIVMAYRNPFEIARSLQIRNGMPIPYGIALWEHHAVSAIRIASKLPHIFVNHADVMKNPVEETEKLFSALKSAGVKNLSMPPDKEIIDFVDPKLQRAKILDDYALTPFQEMLCSMLRGEIPPDKNIEISLLTKDIMKELANQVSGKPVS